MLTKILLSILVIPVREITAEHFLLWLYSMSVGWSPSPEKGSQLKTLFRNLLFSAAKVASTMEQRYMMEGVDSRNFLMFAKA